ncbi:6-phosphofructokinase [Desulfonispora thiosulfatigenes DSM 11270]|uniref:ATP-dependent 6-phosphofructokinase n=1 Tax=Desulfonispora thiosulfatigenes DSM 11270 TaxID=656914 RepID=A0A1W1UQE7_DESTI|nr:6-phosphofructokinase [Desulfonispora thiosulfatigenes]SMB83031.1 6-phosphofructokinase [Desulfonispora thiosulfatigenes DSM 11270]
MKKIAVLTSGGDAPGMNAAIRAVVRTTIYNGCEAVGIKRGYAGLIDGDFTKLDLGSVADIIQRGGTFLHTARSEEFMTKEGKEEALESIRIHKIDGLVVVGGDGSFRGARELCELNVPVIGVPATIDNDIFGTDLTIGFDTAVNTALDAINRIRDTATSHERIFLIEVMGRNSGWLALEAGLAGGAESILVPETPVDYETIVKRLQRGLDRGKRHSIILVAEGVGSAFDVKRKIQELADYDIRVTVLGHTLRGGTPSATDRIIASKMGAFAVNLLLDGKTDLMAGMVGNHVVGIPLQEIIGKKKGIDEYVHNLAGILAI